MNNLGLTINNIRKMKGLPVTALTDNIISRSEYYRFVRGERVPLADKFFNILSQLNVSLNEFEFIHANNHPTKFDGWVADINQAFNNPQFTKDAKILAIKRVQRQAQAEFEQSHITKFRHLAIMAALFISRLQGTASTPSTTQAVDEIVTYLGKLDTWTHYDIVLFSNTMFAIPTETQTLLIHSVTRNLKKYQDYPSLVSEIFMFTTNLVILAVQHHQPKKVHAHVIELQKIQLQPDAALEQLILLFCNGLDAYLSKTDLNLTDSLQAIKMTKQLGLAKWEALFTNILDVAKIDQ